MSSWRTECGRAVGVMLLLAVGVAPAVYAQAAARGSRTLPVGHWAYEYIQRLRSRGYLAGLNPLVQPYQRLEVAREVAPLDGSALDPPVADWVGILRDELAPELDRLAGPAAIAWGVELIAGGRASTSQRLEPLRPVGDAEAWPRYAVGGWLESGPLAAESRLAGDLYWTSDPDGLDPGQRRGGRIDNGYFSVSAPFGGLELGRMQRNWSTLGTHGVMISDRATSYPQLGLEARLGKVRIQAFTGELDTLLGAKRYVAAHRLDYVTRGLSVSLGEALLYAGSDAGYQLRYVNPLEVFFFDSENPPDDRTVNVMLNAQLWYQRGAVEVYGDFLLDDIDVNRTPGVEPAPTRYAFTVGVRARPWAGVVAAEYQQVSSFAYRTSPTVDHFSFLGRGLGETFADYDRLSLGMELYPGVRGLIVSPTAQVLRQGEGDLRVPFPDYDLFRASPNLFLGTVETTYRLALRGRYQPNRHVWVAYDLGHNWARNAGHVVGNQRSRFSAVGELAVSVQLPVRKR